MKLNTNTKLHLLAQRKGFTLIELLVVMAIIAVLASVSFSPIISFINKGKLTEAASVANDFETAIEAFNQEYTYLPFVDSTPESDEEGFESDNANGAAFIEVLMGTEEEVNDKQIEYFVPKVAKNNASGILDDGTVLNPWGDAYIIRLDYDGDGSIDTSLIDPFFSGFQNASSIISSAGPSGFYEEEEENATSW